MKTEILRHIVRILPTLILVLAGWSGAWAQTANEAGAGQDSLDEAERLRAEYMRELELKNRPGTAAPDFRFEDRDGHEKSLYDLPNDKRTLLIFYDPDCQHCWETFEALQGATIPSDIHVAAISAEGDRMLWDASKDQLPDTWTVGYAIDPIIDEDLYVIEETPAMFLLGKDKRVEIKHPKIQDIIQ